MCYKSNGPVGSSGPGVSMGLVDIAGIVVEDLNNIMPKFSSI